MCRHNQLLGCCALAFGAGLLLGLWLESGFLAHCLGLGLVLIGLSTAAKFKT